MSLKYRSQRYATFQKSITGNSMEEKLIGPTRANNYSGKNRPKAIRSQ